MLIPRQTAKMLRGVVTDDIEANNGTIYTIETVVIPRS